MTVLYYPKSSLVKVLGVLLVGGSVVVSIVVAAYLYRIKNTTPNVGAESKKQITTTNTRGITSESSPSDTLKEQADLPLATTTPIPNLPSLVNSTPAVTESYPDTLSLEGLTVKGSIKFPSGSLSWYYLSKHGSSINDLGDIKITNPQDGDYMVYDSNQKKWVDKTLTIYGKGKEIGPESYVIYAETDGCYAFNPTNGNTDFSGTDCSSVIQGAVNKAGVGGVISFRAGTYIVKTELSPLSEQTWLLSQGVIFAPQGNNRILNISGIDEFTTEGALTINDSNSRSTSVEAIAIDDMAKSYFERVSITNYFRGMSITGTAGGTNENDFSDIYMQVRDRGLSMETSSHDNHFGQIWIKGPSPTDFATGSGIYIATSGTQGGNTFDHVEVLDMNVGLELPGAYETWFGNVLVDNPYGVGISIGGSCERLFFDTVWTSSGGDGMIIAGDTASYADKIQIDKLYSWLNSNYGLRIDGYVEDLTIGMLTVQRNGKGFVISGVQNREINISSLTSYENTEVGVDGSGSTRNVFVENAMIYDTSLGLDYFTKIGGVRVGTGLFQAKGIAKILSGQSTVTVNHGLEGIPTFVNITPYDAEVVGSYISARDATSFTITVPHPVTADREIGWQAESGRQLGSELVSNQSVEDGTDSPSSWYSSVSGTDWSTSEFRSGQHSLHINVTNGTAEWRADHFGITGSQTYRLRAFAKGTGSNQTFLTIRWFSGTDGTGFISEDNIRLDTTYADWTEVKDDLTAPVLAKSADVLFRAASSTTASIFADEFSVRSVN